jgi:1-acyl-sn-glycerol-3-phosphate acyltransferase
MAKQKSKIQDRNLGYSILKPYVDFLIKCSYNKILRVGKEKLPKDGAIILAPNHTNTLMDALVVLSSDKNRKVFVARADIFRFPVLPKIFTFLKIMPIMRLRDGFRAVKQNQEIIDKAVDVLKDRVPFCIFPEGTHLAKYSMLPISKGIFKIAFQAHEELSDTPLYIVPVGIRYGDFFRFRSSVRLEFGEPINVGEYIAEHAEQTQSEQMNGMKDMLTERLRSVILYVPNDENYNATIETCAALESYEIAQLGSENKAKHALDIQLLANRATLKRIESLKESNPEEAAKLFELANEAYQLRQKKGIDIASVSAKKPLMSRTARNVITLCTLPYTIPASILASPVVLLSQFISTKIKDPAFGNSIKFVVNLVLWTLLVVVYGVLAFTLLPWQWAIVATLLAAPAPFVAHELWKTVRLAISDIKLIRTKRLKTIYSQIKAIVLKSNK